MSSAFVTIHGEEWRKADIDEPVQWAKTKVWKKETWKSDSENWDHDHCQICWWKLFKSDIEAYGMGYRNHENDNWICTECYDQFVANP